MAWTSLLLLVGSILTAYIAKVTLFSRKRAPFPPGPKPKFVIGNLFDLPKPGEVEYVHWLNHRELFGSCGENLAILSQTYWSWLRTTKLCHGLWSDTGHNKQCPNCIRVDGEAIIKAFVKAKTDIRRSDVRILSLRGMKMSWLRYQVGLGEGIGSVSILKQISSIPQSHISLPWN